MGEAPHKTSFGTLRRRCRALATGTEREAMPRLDSAFLREHSFVRRNPEFAAEFQELLSANEYAKGMVKAGKLSPQEFEDFEGSLYQKLIEALPIDDFHEMMKDGRLQSLQDLAGHDGTRDVGDVEDARREIDKKVIADALDEAWLFQKIDHKTYTEASRKIETSEDLDNRLADGDYEDVAVEMFGSRNDVPDHDADIKAYCDKTYGKSAGDKPAGRVVRESQSEEYDPKKSIEENLVGKPEPQRTAVDANGIIDLDILAAEQAA
jgi:hypothetical protein